ncbi:hypothetical protein J7K97_06810 [Candidatus Aerophobetes bacterium]|nr:hypothetical protein [Candidatus Aerophobetes bacterium]
MRKVLIGVLIACLSVGLATVAFATEFSWSGSAEFGIEGTSDGASGDFFGSASLTVDATATSGPWGAGVTLEDGAISDGYISYSGAAFTLTMYPLGVDNGVFDVEIWDPAAGALVDPLGIPSNPGLKLDVPMEGFDFYAVVNNHANAQVTYNFAGGVGFSMGPLGLDFTFNSNQENKTSSYGAQVSYSAGSMSFTGQYGGFAPEGGDALTGYYGKLEYTLPGGSAFTLSYNGSGEYGKIYGEFTTPLAENVDLTFDVTSTNTPGADTVTGWEGKIGFSV